MTVDNWIQLLVPIIGIIVAAVSAGLSYVFAKKQQIVSDESRLKEECYLAYIDALSNNVLSDNREDAKSRLSDAHNRILLIGNAKVVERLRTFTNYIGPMNGRFDQTEHDTLLTDLIKEMRYDLY